MDKNKEVELGMEWLFVCCWLNIYLFVLQIFIVWY